jgi:hypothetical protein
MAAREGPPRRASSRAEPARVGVDRTHEVIRGLLDDLQRATEPPAVLELLDRLAGVLPPHFEEEEGPDGLFAELVSQRPSNDHRVKTFRREHGEILEALEALRRKIRELQHALAGIEASKTGLLKMVRKHEQGETRFAMDTYLVDEGGPG